MELQVKILKSKNYKLNLIKSQILKLNINNKESDFVGRKYKHY